MTDKRIGVIGLGEMGGTIARRLRSIGAKIVVHDNNATLRTHWPESQWTDTLAEVGEAARIILVVVATDEQVTCVVKSLEDNMSVGAIVIIHSTVMPGTIQDAEATVAAAGGRLMDAGMSRGAGRMSDGSLTLYVGADEATLLEATPVFRLYADNVVHAGRPGCGMVMKLCNNLALHGNRMVLLEAARIADAHGVPLDALLAGIRAGTGSSWVAHHWGRADHLALSNGAGRSPMATRTRRELDSLMALAEAAGVDVPNAALVSRRLPDILQNGLQETGRAHQIARQQAEVTKWREGRDRAGEAFWSHLLVLTTIGARTGCTRECVLEFFVHEGTAYVFGSNGGRRHNPDWVYNLRSNPRATVEIGCHVVEATAEFVEPDQASQIYRRRLETNPAYAQYSVDAGPRRIPIVRLRFDRTIPQLAWEPGR